MSENMKIILKTFIKEKNRDPRKVQKRRILTVEWMWNLCF